MVLTNEQLLMLDALVYYNRFSDEGTPYINNDKSIGYKTVGSFVTNALANPNDYKTCFDGY